MNDDWRSIKLEPFKKVLNRIPPIPGEPYPMKVHETDGPKNCGDPWKGAYSKHGYWYKFHEGTLDDYAKIIKLANDQDDYFLLSPTDTFLDGKRMIVAKNLKNEILGAVLASTQADFHVIGAYFVVEDFRHSGIGEKLFRQICIKEKVVFHAMSHLLPSVSRFGLKTSGMPPRVLHITISEPGGFQDLRDSTNSDEFEIVSDDNLTTEIEKAAELFIRKIYGTNDFPWKEAKCTQSVAMKDTTCIGYASSREVYGGSSVPRILVGPVQADSSEVAEALLKQVIKTYYNPETDYDFDPDVYAIYRRDVHFHVHETQTEFLELLKQLKGDTGQMKSNRLHYETCSNFELPAINLEKVFCLGDLHTTLI